MPMKRPCDLSPDEFVFVHEWRTKEGHVLEVSLRIHPKPSADITVKWKSLEDLRELGFIKSSSDIVSGQEPSRAGISQIKVATGDAAWRVLNSDASAARWGPFLYDIAMELASLAKSGLCSHESDVSSDALKVWDFYFTNRSDVTKTKLPRKLKPKRREESLQYAYRKSPPVFIEELKSLGKWIERYTICDGE